ncbi:GNAT family N-acetyltransferase [Streptomyces polyrhachis]|uniref:GNAT family N-acetyltransferase n=1 Tax=Streptomyces polyrhachis TaxID=1282885 RepID=A0ABW2G7W6_9ACTN
MIGIRPARVGDASELVRLRRMMFAAMNGRDEPGSWERDARAVLEEQLGAEPAALGAFVVDGAEPGRLAACAVGRMEQRLPAPGHPTGRFGFVFSVCTEPRYRGRGYGRGVMLALLDWFAGRGVSRVDLHASPEAERLYRSLGFREHPVALSLDVSRR